MGKINGCLKCLFIFFNVLFALIGVALIGVAIQFIPDSHEISKVGSQNLAWIGFLVIGLLCIVSISCLGHYAVSSEKEIVLKIFEGFMVVLLIIMLISGIVMVVKRNKVKSSFEVKVAEAAKSLKENEELRKKLDGLQQDRHCCGVVSASDWGDNIPRSCECSGYGGYGGSECKSKPQGVSGPDRIYAQPCSQIMFMSEGSDFKITFGMCFGYAIIPLLGLLVSILMIHQVHDGRIFHSHEEILRRPLTSDL